VEDALNRLDSQDRVLERLRKEVEEAREEFDLAKKAVFQNSQTVRDIGIAAPDGYSLWQRTIDRYNRAVRTYSDALHRFAEVLVPPRDKLQ